MTIGFGIGGMVKHFDIRLPREVHLKGAPGVIATIDDAKEFVLRAPAKTTAQAPLNRTINAVMKAAETESPEDLEAAAKCLERLVAHCRKR
ncbi:hypothetical protein ABLE91_16995 [Aquabacter sp. CN5-332]|uniref:hypothetical protein n=1 Tax=Aquabacter sp. CN5-332 TaxID=3156608 RepID=UPI0032B4EA6D